MMTAHERLSNCRSSGQMTGLGEEHLPSRGEALGASVGGPMVGDGDAPAEFAS